MVAASWTPDDLKWCSWSSSWGSWRLDFHAESVEDSLYATDAMGSRELMVFDRCPKSLHEQDSYLKHCICSNSTIHLMMGEAIEVTNRTWTLAPVGYNTFSNPCSLISRDLQKVNIHLSPFKWSHHVQGDKRDAMKPLHVFILQELIFGWLYTSLLFQLKRCRAISLRFEKPREVEAWGEIAQSELELMSHQQKWHR